VDRVPFVKLRMAVMAAVMMNAIEGNVLRK
jgi:hypothetical protein